MREEKEYTEGIAIEKGKFLSWLENFWYHYKWHTVIAAFLLIVAVVCIAQSCTKEKSDIAVIYAGPVYLDGEKTANIRTSLSQNLPKDSFGDEAVANALSYLIMSEEQIKEAEKGLNPDGSPVYIDRAFIVEQQETFDSLLATDKSSILLLDPYLFNMLGGNADSVRLCELSDVLGYTPEGAVSRFGIRLGDTSIYNTNPALQVLPADTVLCVHVKRYLQKEEDYQKEVEAFKAFAVLDTDGDKTE